MAQAPQIALRDNSGFTTNLVLSTNMTTISVTGMVSVNTVDLQVSINGGPFVSDPSLVALNGQAFIVPNPSSFPEGIALELGLNLIALRAIDIVGGVSSISTASVTRIEQTEGLGALIPTAIRAIRARNTVDILANKPNSTSQDFDFTGYNFYASTAPAGTTGYYKLNSSPITTDSTIFEEDLLNVSAANVVFPVNNAVRVKVTTLDAASEETLVYDVTSDTFAFTGDLKFTGAVQSRTLTEFIKFTHNRTTGPNADQFVDVDSTAPLYYVVTGVFFDAVNNKEFETPYSQEVLGTPLIIDTTIRDLPGRVQFQIVVDFVRAIQRSDTEISLIPGSTTRDVEINPFASEAERIWFLVDFVHKSSSFLTLLQIDDPNGDGVSDSAATDLYKISLRSALGLQTSTAVQQLIDVQFDKLAGNFQKTRLPGRPSVGQALFFSETKPTQDITIASGTIVSSDADAANGLPAARFLVGGTFVLPAAQADAFYNFSNRRYEIVVDIVAETVGASGNRPAGSIKNLLGSAGGFQVTNTEATVFGSDRESNADLAARAMLGFVSIDTGTEGGYTATSAGQIGVIKTKVVKSGDPLMMRDYDEVRKKHIGGKVDVWVQGLRERTVTERFAFTFSVARDIRCQVLDIANLTFRVLDSRVTINSPITEVINNPSQGFGVRNVTQGLDYDLTGVTILDYQTFQLNTAIPQPSTAVDDIVTADYRFRSANLFTFTLQPVRRVVSVVGEASGALDNTLGFNLYKTEDPLLNGESTIAQDHLVINQVGGIPTGATISVNDEQRILIGSFEEPLGSIGINTATVRVFSQDRVTEFNGPASSATDFNIIAGTSTTPAKIVRANPSNILSGQVVSVDYDHDENFTVTYVINDILQQLQRTINGKRHITADVLVKQSILNSIALESTLQLKNGASKDKVDPAVRSSVSLELNQKLIGQGVAQSDVIKAIDATDGVDFQVLPMAKMGYTDGSRKLRESILSTNSRIPSLDIGGNQVFILLNALQFPTTDGGGLITEHRGVFEDDEPMVLADTLAGVGQHPNQAFIIGSSGAIITGFSDDATLISEGFATLADIERERSRRTSNHILLSLSGAGIPPDSPVNHIYAISYIVRNDVGPHDITAAQVETLDLGDFTLTIRS